MINNQYLLDQLEKLFTQSQNITNDFGGPSIYFHNQAIIQQKEAFLSYRHLEMIYATLASWGMHRMGETKTKIYDFQTFSNSIMINSEILNLLKTKKMHQCTITEYGNIIGLLKPVFETMKVSISESAIVANSKVLAHILPELIPPIDRQYTVRFFTQDYKDFITNNNKYKSVQFQVNKENQFEKFKHICFAFKNLLDQCNLHIFNIDGVNFNTSFPKILDNIIMTYVKSIRKVI